MNLDWMNPTVDRRALFRFAWQWLAACAAQNVLWNLPASVETTNIPWQLEKAVGNVAVSGNYEWGYHGNEAPLISALKDLRSHFPDGRNPELAPVLESIGRKWGIPFGGETLRPMERLVRCSDENFLAFQRHITKKSGDLKKQKQKAQADKNSQVLQKHPLQYVTSHAVGFILGIESHEPGDLVEILWRHVTYHFSPDRPNTPNHHIGFSWVVTWIHCILSGKIIE